MEVKTYRAKSLQEALQLVRRDLGPRAAVLHARELRWGWLCRWYGGPQFEVTAFDELEIAGRASDLPGAELDGLPGPNGLSGPNGELQSRLADGVPPPDQVATLDARHYRHQFRAFAKDERTGAFSLVDQMCRCGGHDGAGEMPQALFQLFARLLDADIDESVARQLVQRLRDEVGLDDAGDTEQLQQQVARLLEADITTSGPIQVQTGKCRVIALVGQTGVGKTTTIAKLAANMRLREKRRVALITVDTYRIAAVDQLRTYADIIDLPMEVVATPRDMREAVARLSDFDIVFVDTAGRSPHDELQLQELKAMLHEARADEVHLVLSAGANTGQLCKAVGRFAEIGTTNLVITKLDEVTGIGNLLPVFQATDLPLSYVTDGQNVPDDIQVADARQLVDAMLNPR